MKDQPENLSEWYSGQLRASGDGFIWAVRQVTPERRSVTPPSYLGDWSATRHLFHMLFYEREFALPTMRIWLGDPAPDPRKDEQAAFSDDFVVEEMLSEFEAVRKGQIALMAPLSEVWNDDRDTGWGPRPLRWVVGKTFQHTAEHTHDVMSLALFW